METCSAGDLTRRMDPESDNEAMAEIADAFNDMMNRIDRTVAHLRGLAEEVAASSEEVTASSEEVRSASQQVTGSVQEISAGAERQKQHFQTVSEEIDDLSNAIQKIAGATDQVAELAAETADTGQEGRESAEEAIEGMVSVQSRAETAVDAIETLQAEMEHIDELSEFIAEIAHQTNMLALNANIEASRSNSAGDGQGFAVVASEVKELAEEAREAAEEIDERLERIQGQTAETADEVPATSGQIADHAETVEEAAIALDEIAGYGNQTNQGVQQISSATQQQSASAQQILAMVDRAESISAETTNEAENVAAAAEEQTTSLTEVTRSAGHLSKKSNRLQETLARIEKSKEAIDSGDVLKVLTAPDEETVGDAKSIDDLMGPSGGAEVRSSDESEIESDATIDAKRPYYGRSPTPSDPYSSPTSDPRTYDPPMDFLGHRKGLVEDRLERVVDGVDPDELADELRHVTLSGGKRVRPVVTLLACEAAGGDIEQNPAVNFGVGIELVHSASLVVDDIIDQSATRRGVDSAWAGFGYGPAIVASDGLLGEAFALFSTTPEAMQVVTEAMVDLGQGEATELVARPGDEEAYMELARRKTGALFRAAAELGAIAADADPFTIETFGDYAERVGVAFQIRDDVLDATADPDDLGKPTGQDAAMDRPSIVQVTGLSTDEANALARDEADRALAALDAIEKQRARADGDSRGNDAQAFEYLRDLAEFVVVRER